MAGKPTDITGSRRRRQRARMIRLALRGLVVVAVLALIGGIVWGVGFSPLLAATRVEVRGTAVLTVDQVTATAAVPLGTPLARLDTGSIVTRVKTLAPVATVEVSRSWPHTVVVTVVERTPVYGLRTDEGPVKLVDSSGAAYYEVPTAPDGLLPAKVASKEDRALRDVAVVVAALPPSVRSSATLVTAESVDNIVVELDGGRRLVWGSAEQSEAKGKVAEALLKVKATVYDVSAPSHPATRA